jgi:hypothetical protein
VVTAQARRNIFTGINGISREQQLSKFLINDYGIGTNQDYITGGVSADIIVTFIKLKKKFIGRSTRGLQAEVSVLIFVSIYATSNGSSQVRRICVIV